MTDITELAQREKFEAWFKSSFHPDKTGPYIKDQLFFAWEAAGAELVEALEKVQTENIDGVAGMAESYETTISMLRSRIAELESRTVKLLDCDLAAVQHMSGGSKDYCNGFVDGTQNAIRAITAAGIKVEAE